MAVSISNLTASYSTGTISSAVTASISPSSNALILLSVMSRRGDSTEPSVPTVTGNGLTWVNITSIYYDTASTSRKKLSLFRAMGSSPTSGTVTIDFSGENQTDIFWTIDEATNVDTSGTNGSGAVVQSATAKEDAGDGGLLTVTLGAFSSTNNATYGTFTSDNGGGSAITVGSGFTLLNEQHPVGLQETLTEWNVGNDTTVDATTPSSAGQCTGGIAVEIKALSNVAPVAWLTA